MRKYLAVPVLLLTAMLVACSPSQITLSLKTAALAAQMALGAYESTGGQLPGVASYIADASNAIDLAGTCLASTEAPAVRATCVTAAIAGIVKNNPNLPAGTPAKIVAAIATLSQALQGVLITYGTTPISPLPSTTLKATRSAPAVSSADLDKARGEFKSIAAQARKTKDLARLH